MQSGPKVSMGMVFQPFSTMVWAFVGSIVGITYFASELFHLSRPNVGQFANFKFVLALAMGVFMTVTIAYYNCAILLDLTSMQSAPFETLLDGLADQDWNLVYDKSEISLYESYYELIPEGKKLKDATLNPDYIYIVSHKLVKFQYLTNHKTFMLEDKLGASHFMRTTTCQECKDAVSFGRPEIMNSGFLFQKNSPLREVFKIGMVHLRETGAIEYIKHSWAPDYIPQPTQCSLPLTIHLLAMLFIFLGVVVLAICPSILVMEYLIKWLTPRPVRNSENQQLVKCGRIYEGGKMPTLWSQENYELTHHHSHWMQDQYFCYLLTRQFKEFHIFPLEEDNFPLWPNIAPM